MTDDPHPSGASAYAPDLRRRADHLSDLARSIERSVVMTLADVAGVGDDGDDGDDRPGDRRTMLCHALLRRNLHQLHRAADDLRVTAMRFRTRADELDAAFRTAA